MLRMSYMPSDFHPILLVLGTTEDMLTLGDILRAFAEKGGRASLNDAGVFSTDTQVELLERDLEAATRPGLWPSGEAKNELVWCLPKAYAADFADAVGDLARSGEAAGSTFLECEVADEIKVKVSIGEWEDHYLTDDRR